MFKNNFYIPPTPWTGRDDPPHDDTTKRWHHVVTVGAIHELPQQKNFALLGFCSDEGVRRNHGRLGASDGPQHIRTALMNLAWHGDDKTNVTDAGNVVCNGSDLEGAQTALAEAVQTLVQKNYLPIVLGGGHEIAYGHYLGLKKAYPKKKIGIINLDAHFDLRPVIDGATSGTPFLQIAKDLKKNGEAFQYLVLGIRESANTQHLFDTAKKYKVEWITEEEINSKNFSTVKTKIRTFAKKCDLIYLTLCLDVIDQSYAPGVSAPAALGLDPKTVRQILNEVNISKKVIGFDIAELCPRLDRDEQTAKLAAAFVNEWVQK